MDWKSLLYLVAAGLMAWLAMRTIRANPQAFTSENFFKSGYTLGVLALILIGVISLTVYFLR